MLTTRSALATVAFLSALFLSAAKADAQTAVSYHFLEVLDTGGKPLADARVESVGSGPTGIKQTDEHGIAKDVPVYSGDFNTRAIRVSKQGYITYEGADLFDRSLYAELFEDMPASSKEEVLVKVVLLKVPVTAAERDAVEAEQRRRELLLAVKQGDVANAKKLLRAGVSPNASDVNGIPAILFAAVNGDGAMIKALLASGADVRNKSGPGRKALLRYIYRTRLKAIDVEVVRSLVDAGADVNAADKYGATVLGLAKQSNNPELVKLLERAGARQ
jgi:Ankyrin repeats (many copies)